MLYYLVTGGAGFIGQAIAYALKQNGHAITILDRSSKLQSVSLDPEYSVVAGDIAHINTYQNPTMQKQFDAVFHLAGQSSARISHEQPEEDIDTNAKGTLMLVEWCLKQGIDRILYASSMGVYGNPKQLPVTEETELTPVSYYGVSKLAGEHYLQVGALSGLKYTTFRLFNVYGPGQDMLNLKQGMISVYLAYVIKGEEIPVTGSLERFRDFIYIDDVVNAWLQAVDNRQTYNKTYNLGSGIKTSVRDLINMIIETCGYKPEHYLVKNIGSHAGDIFGMLSDSHRFYQDCNWSPKISLQDGIRKMVSWLRLQE